MSRLSLLALTLLSSATFAATSWRVCQPDRIFIGPEYQHRSWHLFSTRTHHQNMWGGVGGFEHLAPEELYFRSWSRVNSGKCHGGWYDHEWRLELDAGYSWAFGRCHNWILSPFVGVGYFQDREDTYGGRFLHEYEIYVPVGLLVTWDISRAFTIGLRGQADIQVHRALVNRAAADTQMSKHTDWVVELPVTYRFCSPWDVSLVPEFQFDPHSVSNSGTDWGSITTWGVRLEVGYRW